MLRIVSVVAAVLLALVVWTAATRLTHPAPAPSPTSVLVASATTSPAIQTEGWAPPPSPDAPQLTKKEADQDSALAAQAGHCPAAQAATTIHGALYIGCSDGLIVVTDANGKVKASGNVSMHWINAIVGAGSAAIAVSGANDGAALRGELSILRISTLKPIVRHAMSDSTFLGTIADRAYIDDWCCNGRSDGYRPATIYSVSLVDGTESKHIDLTPDFDVHSQEGRALGQGEHNYLIGTNFYVVVGDVTYRYDVRDLQNGPTRLTTAPGLR